MSRAEANGHNARVPHPMSTTPRFSAWKLFRQGMSRAPWPRVWDHHDLEPTYDVVIIGGGVHGLATAYYLA